MENTILTVILIVGILVALGVMIHTAIDEYKNTKIKQESVGKVYGFKKSAIGSDARDSARRSIAERSVASEEEPKVTSSHPRKKRQNDKSKTKSRRNTVKAGRRANR